MWADLDANADRLVFLQGRIRLPLQDRQASQLHSPQTSRSRSGCSRASFPQAVLPLSACFTLGQECFLETALSSAASSTE